jgi:hypothetical protein
LCQGIDGLGDIGHGAVTFNGGEIREGASDFWNALTGDCVSAYYCQFFEVTSSPDLTTNSINPDIMINPNILGNPNLTINPNQPQFTMGVLIRIPNPINSPQNAGSSCPEGEDVCTPPTVQANAGHCVVCLRPGTCGVPVSQECAQPDYSNAHENASGAPSGQAQIGEGGGGGHAGSYGGGGEGGSFQGSTPMLLASNSPGGPAGFGGVPAPQSGVVPVIAAPAGSYSPGRAAGFSPEPGGRAAASLDGVAPGGRAGGGGPMLAVGRGGDSGRTGRDGLRAPEPLGQKGGAGADDWSRRAAVALKRGDMDAAVQALMDGIDADAAARGGAAYSAAVARELLEAMGMDADSIARMMAGKRYLRFKEHFEKAMQARARGDIDAARKELAKALAALLGRKSAAWAFLPLAALAALAGLVVFLVRRRRRKAQGPPA